MKSFSLARPHLSYKNSYLACLMMYGFYYMSFALLSSLISVYLMDIGYSASQVSLVVSFSFITSIAIQPLISNLSMKVSPTKLSSGFLALSVISALLLCFFRNFWLVLIAYGASMMLLNGTNPVMEKSATASPFSYGSIRIWGTIGYALGVQAAGILYERIAPNAIFFAFIVSILLCVLACSNVDSKKEEAAAAENRNMASVIKAKGVLTYAVISILFYGITNMNSTYLPAMLQENRLSIQSAAAVITLATFIELPVILFSKFYMDKLSNKTLLSICFGLVFIQTAVFSFSLPAVIQIPVVILSKASATMLYIMVNLKVVATLLPNRQISGLALLSMIKSFASILIMNGAGFLIDVFGYRLVYQICMIAALIALAVIFRFKINKQPQQKKFS